MPWMCDDDTKTRAESICEAHLRRKGPFPGSHLALVSNRAINPYPCTVFVVKLGRLIDNSTSRLGTSNGMFHCRSIAKVNIPCGLRHCTHPLIVTTSLDTRPLKSTGT